LDHFGGQLTAAEALEATTRLLSFAMILQALEIFLVARTARLIWSYENLKRDFELLPLPNGMIKVLFGDHALLILPALQIAVAGVAMIFPHPALFSVLFVTHLMICMRFRGAFNGGSDMMTVVILTGVLIALFASSGRVQKLGLLYIAVQLIYSYLKSGLAKISNRDWRSGLALPTFLARSLFTDVRRTAIFLRTRLTLSRLLSVAVLIFELGSIGAVFFPKLLLGYFACAVAFHFSIYLALGLNRFFWIWLCAWPALFYSARLFA
jgi:hypothetical protein